MTVPISKMPISMAHTGFCDITFYLSVMTLQVLQIAKNVSS